MQIDPYLKQAAIYCNQPLVREILTNSVRTLTFAYGILEVSNETLIYWKSLQGRVQKPDQPPLPSIYMTTIKVTVLVVKWLLVLSVLQPWPSFIVASLSQKQVASFFYSHRHLIRTLSYPPYFVSLTSLVLGIPSTVCTCYEIGLKTREQIHYYWNHKVVPFSQNLKSFHLMQQILPWQCSSY